jgi:HD-GYP domain-containing protein (c-di-GMP phosphodiesterase class II)
MNGSGYPQGLSGEEILLEARVLAVADVVEAMSSHRPYRAALSIKTALEEITKNRGTLYEPSAVNACLALYEEKNDLMPKADKYRKYSVRKNKVKIRRFG